MVGVRELNIDGIPENNWINDHFKYTHGYGMVAAKGTTVTGGDDQGRRPVTSPSRACRPTGDLGAYQPRIYFGEQTKQYSIVDGPTKELDYTDTSGETGVPATRATAGSAWTTRSPGPRTR